MPPHLIFTALTKRKMKRLRRPEKGRRHRLRANPHRAGNRIRLLQCARGTGAERGRISEHHDQLQSGNSLHRLRYQRPALFRIPGRREHPRQSWIMKTRITPTAETETRRQSCSSAGRPQSIWPTRWQGPACRYWAPAPNASTFRRTAAVSSSSWATWASTAARSRCHKHRRSIKSS